LFFSLAAFNICSLCLIFVNLINMCLGWLFCILAVRGVLFIVEFPCCGWAWMGGLSRFPG